MPPNHQKYVQWNGERFRQLGVKIGENTITVFETILTTHKVEQQGHRACMALLKLSEQYTPERLKAACARALFYTPRPSYLLQQLRKLLQRTAQRKIFDRLISQRAARLDGN